MTALRRPNVRLQISRLFLLPAVVVLVGLLLRLWGLGAQSLWFDEAQTLFIARLPFSQIVQRAYRPPLYHFLLHFWDLLVPDREFWLRLPSVLCGVVTLPLVYGAALRLYNRRVALVAAGLAAISPTLVWYSQELRMYSLMAGEYAALLWLFPALVWPESRPRWGTWVAFWALEAAALYTHYFAIPFLAWLALAGALALTAGRHWRALLTWCGVQAAALVAFVPWLLLIGSGRGGTEDYIGAEVLPTVTVVTGVRDFVAQSGNFYIGGSLAADGVLRWLVPGAALILAVGSLALLPGVVAWVRRAGGPLLGSASGAADSGSPRGSLPESDLHVSRSDFCLLLAAGGPAITALLMYHWRPGVVHPRHLMMVAVPLVILVARVGELFLVSALRVKLWQVTARGAGALLLTAFGAAFVCGLAFSYTLPSRQRPDTRSLARHVQELTGEGDVVLFSYLDYAFDYYFRGPACTYHLETRVGDADLAGWLLPRIQGTRRAVLLRWVDAFTDARDFLPWLLQSNGRLVDRFWQAQRFVSVYDLDGPLVLPRFATLQVRVDPLRLGGLALPDPTPADQPVAIALEWTSTATTSEDLKVSVRALDESGRTVAADDRVLLSEQGAAGTSHWPAGLTARNYYFLDLPVGTPPLTYTLAVSVYHERTALDILNESGAAMGTVQSVGSFQVLRPSSFPEHFAETVPMTRVGREVAPGLELEGFSLGRETVRAGELLPVTLYWKATRASLPAYEPALCLLGSSERVLGEQKGEPASGRYPTDCWQQGELVIDHRDLLVLPEAEQGQAQLLLQVDEGEALVLQRLVVEQADRSYTFPEIQQPLDVTLGGVARLVGYHLERTTIHYGEPVRLTLYWQAINDAPLAASYTVFTHLLSTENQVVAQHDGLPAAGAWPTTAWVKNQAIVDAHEMTFRDIPFQGEALVEVGLYDAHTFQRLATPQGEDRILLPVQVTVLP